MRDHLRSVRLFGKDYCWDATPGQPLQLLPAPPWPDPVPDEPVDLYEEIVRLYARPLPLPWDEATVTPAAAHTTPKEN